MSDASVASALRSNDPLVVIEAPAGCGKTHQASVYAEDVATSIAPGRALILAHTHAACDTFAERSREPSGVDIRTIDSLIVAIAAAYPASVHITGDVGAWARGRKDGYPELARRVAQLLGKSPGIARMLARRFPIVICDEHQDANEGQHAIVMALHGAGARLRIFGDPMQALFDDDAASDAAIKRWTELSARASQFERLDYPHRWRSSPELGAWILAARTALSDGRPIDLASRPNMVSLIFADNAAPAKNRYQLPSAERKPIDTATTTADELFILSPHSATVGALRAFFNRRFPIWEGHVRKALVKLATAIEKHEGDAIQIANATLKFTDALCTGFSASAFGNELVSEIGRGCTPSRRGKPGTLQSLGKFLLEEPNHRGVSKFLRRLAHEARNNSTFKDVRIDYSREFSDGIALGAFGGVQEGMSEIARRRTRTRSAPPPQAISTVHKAKGLERRTVIIMPCDRHHFPDTPKARRVLYVALSRPTDQLTIVASKADQSPLFSW